MSSCVFTVQYIHNDANLYSTLRCVFVLYLWFREAAKVVKKLTLVLQQCVVTYYVCGLDTCSTVHTDIINTFPIFARGGASFTHRDHYKLT
jgi:hypothetical protein